MKKSWWKTAFAIPKDDPNYDEHDMELINKLAAKIVGYGMTTFAIVMIDSSKPLNFLSSQVMYFFEPIIKALFNWEAYTRFAKILEHRKSLEILLQRIEFYEANPEELRKILGESSKINKKSIIKRMKQIFKRSNKKDEET